MEAVGCILKGEPVPCKPLTLSQNPKSKFKPLVKKTVTYIVCGIVINDDNQVLLAQEAKESCYGKWYLPAGRMEKGETITEAVKREVQEETGLLFEPVGLLLVEFQPRSWYRFTMYGRVTGGSIKTPAQKDKESIQGGYWSIKDVLSQSMPLRANDILALIQRASDYKTALNDKTLTPCVLPCEVAHTKMILRTVCVRRTGDSYQILLNNSSSNPFLGVVLDENSHHFLGCAVQGFAQMFGHSSVNYTLHGILSVEHDGRPAHTNDGLCLTILLVVSPKTADVQLEPKLDHFTWQTVSQGPVQDLLVKKLSSNSTNITLKID